MEAKDKIKKFVGLIEDYYKDQLLQRIKKDEKYLLIDFSEIIKFDHELAEDILEEPEETIKAAEIAVEQFDTLGDVKKINVRFFNLPDIHRIMVGEIRSRHLNKFLLLEGTVRQKSDVKPMAVSAKFECPSCGNIINVLQLEKKFKEPTKCGCGRKGKFRLMDKELVDAQRIVLEESLEDIEGGEQPKKINLILKDDLASPIGGKKTNPGSKIKITGILKEVPINLKDGGKSTTFDWMIESNYVESIDEDFSSIIISKEEEKEIIELSKDPMLYEKLVNSIVPSIYGHDKIKEGVLMQLAGGVRKIRPDKSVSRGDIHILLIGDPGSGKSMILKRISKIAPKGRFISGKGASGVGLTASVVKDEFISGWGLEAGALVLANKGVCCIDELDKINSDERDSMHEVLEGQIVTIAKANIQATLKAETTVLTAANPKFGRFDPYEIISKQIDLPATLINRFDLIFPIRDLPDKQKDKNLAKFIGKIHQSPDSIVPDIDSKLLRKYFVYSRRIIPKITDGALDEITDYYLEMRSPSYNQEGIQSIPISARQLEALIRMSEAQSRLRLSDKVEKKDAKKAIDMMSYYLKSVSLDPETGKVDIDRIATGITTSERSNISVIKEIIIKLEDKFGKTIPIQDIADIAKEKGIDKDSLKETIKKLKHCGDIFEPKNEYVQRI